MKSESADILVQKQERSEFARRDRGEAIMPEIRYCAAHELQITELDAVRRSAYAYSLLGLSQRTVQKIRLFASRELLNGFS